MCLLASRTGFVVFLCPQSKCQRASQLVWVGYEVCSFTSVLLQQSRMQLRCSVAERQKSHANQTEKKKGKKLLPIQSIA